MEITWSPRSSATCVFFASSGGETPVGFSHKDEYLKVASDTQSNPGCIVNLEANTVVHHWSQIKLGLKTLGAVGVPRRIPSLGHIRWRIPLATPLRSRCWRNPEKGASGVATINSLQQSGG
jgi:hypothetical protein